MKARITWIFEGLHPEANFEAIIKAHGRKVRRDLIADLSPGGRVECISLSSLGPDLITVYNISGGIVSQYKFNPFEARFKKIKPTELLTRNQK